MRDTLETQIIEDANQGDTTVLAELLAMLPDDIIFNALSDANQAKFNKDNIVDSKLQERISNLAEMISLDGDETALGQYQKLVDQSKINGNVMADHIVTMWEPIEFTLTVRQLLDSI